MKALNLDSQKDGCYMNINGRNQLFGQRIYFHLFIFIFMIINLIEFDYQGSYPVGNKKREQGGKLGLEVSLEVIHADVLFKVMVLLKFDRGRVKK